MISKQNFTEPEVVEVVSLLETTVYSVVPTARGELLLLDADAGIEASACARNPTTSTSTSITVFTVI